MDAYRDQYAKIFNGGQGVTLLAISTDADSTQASWARDKAYPFTFLSDIKGEVGKLYGSTLPALVKMALNIIATTTVSLLSYHFLVRSTPLSSLLNGRRYPRAPLGGVPQTLPR